VPEFSGTLDRRLTIDSPSETAGDAVVTWTTDATIWGSMRFLSGIERSGLVAEGAYAFVVRYRADWPTMLTPRKRLGLSGTTRKFGILGVGDPDGRKEQLVITAQELV
jgi:head-tail adaptor